MDGLNKASISLKARDHPQDSIRKAWELHASEVVERCVVDLVQHGHEEAVLVVEVPVDSVRGHSGPLCDLPHRGTCETNAGEQLPCSGKDLVSLLGTVDGIAVARHVVTIPCMTIKRLLWFLNVNQGGLLVSTWRRSPTRKSPE